MVSALKNTATGDTTKKPQRIHTPASILEPLAEFWPDGIQMDPCGSPDSLVEAKVTVCPETGGDGLAVEWPWFTFVNCPWRDLRKWMAYGLTQRVEQVWLVPVRSQRAWWRDFRAHCSAVVELNPVKFVGYDNSFPAPLALLLLEGACDPETPKADTPWRFLDAFEHLGEGRLLSRECPF